MEKNGLKIDRWFHWLLKVGISGQVLLIAAPAIAQITPDATLGTESTRLLPGVTVPGGAGDRIEGGAQRGAALFHSFSQFNVRTGQRVYFANPVGVEAILSRVTGGDPSRILGTLGVEGTASLFLLNPNGILFGREARLDVRGSFAASTGDRFTFPGGEFSAVNPQAPPLLNIQVPAGLQLGTPQSGTILTRGQLTAGQNLSLVGRDLDLQGQLQAGGDLTLRATHTLQLRDSATAPAIVNAGRNLRVQGDRLVDLFALNHPLSGLFAAGNLTLRSSTPISADAHFFTGGNLRVEQLNGDTGALLSLNDPVILAAGDVTLGDYTGASLHILAGGSVTLGSIAITASGDPATTITPRSTNSLFQFLANLSLSDGSSITVEGDRRPTLDVRAGIDWSRVPGGFPGAIVVGTFPGLPTFGSSATSANISVSSFVSAGTPEGADLILTNQYLPNALLAAPTGITIGTISTSGGGAAGSVTMDARSDATLNGAVTTVAPAGGNVRLLATGAIALNRSVITGAAAAGGSSGSLFARANAITVNGGAIDTSAVGGTGGAITLIATRSLSLTPNSFLTSNGAIAGRVLLQGGDIDIRSGQVTVNTATARSASAPSGLEIRGRSLTLSGNSLLSTGSVTTGDAGNIVLDISGPVVLDAGRIFSNVQSSATGNGGQISIAADTLILRNGSVISTQILSGNGNAGNIILERLQTVSLNSRSSIQSGNTGASGRSGSISLNTQALVINNALIQSSASGSNLAGNLAINASNRIQMTAGGRIATAVQDGNAGNGQIRLTTPDLTLANSFLSTTALSGAAGNLSVTGRDRISLTQGSSVSSSSEGTAGNLTLSTNQLRLENAQLSSSNGRAGAGGSITVTASSATLANGRIRTETNASAGGNIQLQGLNTLLMRQNSLISTQAGSGSSSVLSSGGNITIQTNRGRVEAPAANNSDIIATATGSGGRVSIRGQVIGFQQRQALSVSELRSAPSNDLSGSGGVRITSFPDDDDDDDDDDPPPPPPFPRRFQPPRDIPEDTFLLQFQSPSDPSTQVVLPACGGNFAEASNPNQFVVSGRGGLPTAPGEPLSSDGVTANLVTPSPIPDSRSDSDASAQLSAEQRNPFLIPPTMNTITEAGGWVKTADGRVTLVASGASQMASTACPLARSSPP